MARSDQDEPLDLLALAADPQIRLAGRIDDESLTSFLEQLGKVEDDGRPLVMELTSTGGDAETGRRIALEVKLARERLRRRLLFVGKTAVYSAGATVMSGFPARDRYLTEDTVILVHCRKLEKTLELEGPLKASLQRVKQIVSQIETGLQLEREGWRNLIEGSKVSLEEVEEKAANNWYIPAAEAERLGLIAGIIRA